MRQGILTLVVIAISTVCSSGCATFRAHDLPTVPQHALHTAKPDKTRVYSEWRMAAANDAFSQDYYADFHRTAFEKTLAESGCCQIVATEAQAQVTIRGVVNSQSNVLDLFIHPMPALLFLLPGWKTGKIDLHITAQNHSDQNLYKLQDSFTVVHWLPLILLHPFNDDPARAAYEMESNAYRYLVLTLKNDRLI